MRRIIFLFIFLAIVLPAIAWNESGHMTCGAIAYYYLKENDPTTLSKVLTTLKQHPWYSTKWQEKMSGVKEDQKDIALFMFASTYPDDARSIPELGGGEKTKWHYVDYPYSPDGTLTEDTKMPNAESKIKQFLQLLPNETDGSEKATNLSWIFHLIEDVHQPLHTISLFDKNHPNGDRGGNDTYIRFDTIHEAVKLHSYWDRLVTGVIKNIPKNAKKILSEQSISDIEKGDSLPTQWIQGSVSKAKIIVYQSGTVTGTKSNPTFVDKEYVSQAKKEGYHDVYLAGIRLAQVLERIYR